MKQGPRINQFALINRFVLGGFGIIVALVGLSTVMSQRMTRTLSESREWIAHTYGVEAQLRELERSLVDAETGQRGFVITNEVRYLEPYEQATENLDDIFETLKVTISDNPEQLNRLSIVEEIADEKLAELATTIDLKRREKETELLQLILSDQGKDLMDDIRRHLADMVSAEEVLLDIRYQDVKKAELLVAWVHWGSFAGIAVVAIALSVVTSRVPRLLNESLQVAIGVAERVADGDMTVSIKDNDSDDISRLMLKLKQMTERLSILIGGAQHFGMQVTSSSTQIEAAGKQLEGSMREQVTTTTETTATAREIANTAQELAATMKEVAGLSQSTTTAASESQLSLYQMEMTTRALMEATNDIATRLGTISEKANGINSVVTTISKVAEQTNLLSLNAAIEAEKAGEYGAGFAVVAREVRRLADQTAVATLEIDSMVREMQSSVSAGVMGMDKFSAEVSQSVDAISHISGQVTEIIQKVQKLSTRFSLVNEGMNFQAQGAQQISEAMVQLNLTSVQTSDSFEDINTVISQLHQAAQSLQQEMERFKIQETVYS
ncbi:MAG: CHASE3 domain-containing protein [Cyanobacteria bacterium P01_F01_bin.53]